MPDLVSISGYWTMVAVLCSILSSGTSWSRVTHVCIIVYCDIYLG